MFIGDTIKSQKIGDMMNVYLFNRKEFKFRFIAISVILFIFIFPIIHANAHYNDDYARSLAGHINMAVDGRYLSEILMYILNFGSRLCDTAPFFQILSVIVLAFSLSFLSLSWNFGRFSSIFILTLIPCSSFFLENLSYRYDSLPMSFALSCSCLAYCKWSKHNRTRFLANFLFILASLNFYQPSINVFLSLMCFGGLLRFWDSGFKETINFSIYNLFSASLAIFSYMLEISITKHDYEYYKQHSERTYNIHDVFANLIHLLKVSFREFGLDGKGLETFLGLIILCGILKALWISYKKYNIFGLFFSFFYAILSLCFLPGILIFLKYPTFDPRVFMANGVFLCMYMTFLTGRNYKFSYKSIKAFLAVYVLFIQISFSFCWGSALKAQTTLNEYIAKEILEDFSTVSPSGKEIYIRFTSTPSPVSAQAQTIWKRRRTIFETASMRPAEGIIEATQGLHKNEHILWGSISEDKGVTAEENKNFTTENAQNMLRLCHFQKNIHHRYYDMYVDKNNVLIDYAQTCSGK